MSDVVADGYRFACPACGESLEVNDSMKRALVEQGCVVCGASVTAAAFTELSATDRP
ncbi:DUF7560 family zinc ribbon protein [Halococcus salsus]|uniref:DUF7560 family zinc ribbon protein n=1 Tax=Halococcus salsus TaxID=2162894 RepID=UPI0018658001|nr:hypothetical protein [Halococcus salsus]